MWGYDVPPLLRCVPHRGYNANPRRSLSLTSLVKCKLGLPRCVLRKYSFRSPLFDVEVQKIVGLFHEVISLLHRLLLLLTLYHCDEKTVFQIKLCSIFNTLYSHSRKGHNWTVSCYDGNRTLCLPHCYRCLECLLIGL